MGDDFYRENDSKTENISQSEQEKTISRQPKFLVNWLHTQRLSLVRLFNRTEEDLKEINKSYQVKEHELTSEMKSLYKDNQEKLIPGLTYSFIGIMTGSIITKRMSLPYKVFIPIIFGGLCFDYSLPKTSLQLKHKFYQWEQETFPVWTKKQNEMMIELREGFDDCKDFSNKVKQIWNDEVTNGKKK